MLKDKKIAILGAGTMGRAIASGLLGSGKVKPSQLKATDLHKASAKTFTEATQVACLTDNAEAATWADVLLLCVKPKDLGALLEELHAKGALAHKPLLVSIAAGISTAYIEKTSGGHCPTVRVMPNTACAIGKGMTVACKGLHAKNTHIDLAKEIFTPLGRVMELDEKHMNAVTGLSGSGPAFMYVIIEALADGGVAQGLPRNVALELAAQTTLGAAEMVLATGRHPASLKDDVTTPAGTTIAGLLAMEDGRIRSILARAVETAAKKSAELGK
jgi:pyrroline-5-carboxylate reductase